MINIRCNNQYPKSPHSETHHPSNRNPLCTMMNLLANLAAIGLLPILALVILFWLVQDWWNVKRIT